MVSGGGILSSGEKLFPSRVDVGCDAYVTRLVDSEPPVKVVRAEHLFRRGRRSRWIRDVEK